MQRKKILIVDDDKDLLEGLLFLFHCQGYQVVSATEGNSAINIAQTQHPDLIILDLSLPWVDGYKVMERLSSSADASSIPIIVLTGRDAAINQERAMKAGAEAFFHKPFDNDELLAAVDKILEEGPVKESDGKSVLKKILIIDDDRDLLEGLNLLFHSHGYDVVSAMDALSVVGLALKANPDVILLDLSLPGGDGYQVMERLRLHTPLARIPIIVLTGRNPSINQKRAFKEGAKAFFQKPFDNSELVAAVEEALKESASHR